MRTRISFALVAAAFAAASVAPAHAAPAAQKAPTTPQRVIVRVEPGGMDEAQAAARAQGAHLHRQSKQGGFFVVTAPSGVSASKLAGELNDDAGVRYARVAHVVRAAFVPDDTNYSLQWHLPMIGMPEAWDVTSGDPGVTIAIVDSGIDLDHPDLAANIDTANDYDFVNLDSTANDANGHGTHVAGIAAAVTNNRRGVAGIAGSAKVLPVKVLDSRGEGYDYDLARGISYAASKGADIINVSAGAATLDGVVGEAIVNARAAGCIVVAAAGNASTSVPFYPAAYPDVVAVSATTSSDTRASFSNYGSYIDIAAPGDLILSTALGGGTVTMTGTSMASPVVAGVMALLLAQNPAWTEAQVVDRIEATAVDLGAPGKDQLYGAGRIDAGYALFSDTANDEIPGVTPPASPVAGRVSSALDAHDVYAVTIKPGATLQMGLTRSGHGEVNLRLLGPDATTVAGGPVVWSDMSTTYPKLMSFTSEANSEATYYIDVAAASGTANYSLTLSNDYTVNAAFAASQTLVDWRSSVDLAGTVTRPNGQLMAGVAVEIQSRVPGGSWASIENTTTDALGGFRSSAVVTRTTEYRAVVPQQEFVAATASASALVTSKVRLTAPSRPSSPRAKVAFTSVAYLSPAHAAGRTDVKFVAYRYEYGVWRARRTVYAVSGTTTDGVTRYSARVSLPYRGTWMMVARVSADSAHAAGTAKTSKFGVR